MSLINRYLTYFKERRDKLLNGGVNSIPSPFVRFRNDFLGIEQGRYYVVTSSTKGAKTQFASYVFIYNTLLYAYQYPEKVRVKIFYYPLEESKEKIIARFMSYILYRYNKIRVSPKDLASSNNDKPLDKAILDLLESEQYQDILNFFEENIIFSESSNPTGVWSECKAYAKEHGTVHTRKQKITDPLKGTTEVDVFDYYEQADKDEYRIIFIDHVSLVSTERGLTLKQSIDKLSEYCILLRDRYNFTIAAIQQQAFAGEGLDAIKESKVRPTVANLADSKYTSRDCNLLLGLFSPFKYELDNYKGYDITKFKDNIRFLEVLANRDGEMGGLIALFFDGATCTFNELPRPENLSALYKVYDFINKLREEKRKSVSLMLFTKLINIFKKKQDD
jgi:hypothetical protein